MIFTWNKFVILLVIVTLFGLNYGKVFAQSTESVESYDATVNEGDFTFSFTPENPGPFEKVTLRLSSDLVDTNRYLITWTLDGKVVSSGVGLRNLVVSTKDYGQASTIIMTIRLVDSTIQKQVTLTPQDTTILWEAIDSYVPPFYPGKKLPARESVIKIVSLPNFLTSQGSAATKNGVYQWKRNDSMITEAGGYGKDSVIIQHNRIRQTETIEVSSSDLRNNNSGVSKIVLSFFEPSILFYQRNAETGLKNSSAKKSLFLTESSTIIEAEPYFFSVNSKNMNTLDFRWTMNGRGLSVTSKNLTITNPSEPGNAQVGLSLNHSKRLFQSAENSLNINFNLQ